jgi:ribosomal subunit interface protein
MITLDIHAKNIELNDPLRTFIKEKIDDLEHLLGDVGPVHAHIEVSIPSQHHNSGPIYYAEVNLDLNGAVLRAEANNFDMHSAIVDAKDALKVRIKKHKERLKDSRRKPATE